jgi:hypothetical protein
VVNFTVTMPEELKAEMDKYPEVNWSEVIRKSVQGYLQSRQYPIPQLDVEIYEYNVNWNWIVGRPQILFNLKLTDKMNADIVIDRIMYTLTFTALAPDNERVPKGGFEGSFLHYRQLTKNTILQMGVHFYPEVETLKKLTDEMQATFTIDATLYIYVQGFANPFIKTVSTKVPIDEWRNMVSSAIRRYDSHWKDHPSENSIQIS